MKIELTKKEADYLSNAPFWDWKRAELDLKFEEFWIGDNKKALKKVREYHAGQEKFYRELYEKLRSIA
jgi:hypothetical protein